MSTTSTQHPFQLQLPTAPDQQNRPTPGTSVELLLQAMVRFADDHQLLNHYREDLTVHDRALLERMHGWPLFCWVVGPTYSYLHPVGLHRYSHQTLDAVFNARMGGSCTVCWITPALASAIGVSSIDEARTRLRKTPCHERIENRIITPRGANAGLLYIGYRYETQRGRWYCQYDYQAGPFQPAWPDGWVLEFTLAEACACKGLWTIVEHEPLHRLPR